MSKVSYLEKEAEEVEEDDESEEEIRKSSTKKTKKQKKISHFEEDDEDDDDEEEDEIDYEKTKAEFKDFIDDELNESENDEKSSDEKSSESEESELEGDDIDLIKTNLELGDEELEKVGIIKKRRRIKQQLDSSSDEEPSPKERKKSKEKSSISARNKPSRVQSQKNAAADEEDLVEEEETAVAAHEENDDDEEEVDDNRNNDEENLEDFIVDDSDDENTDKVSRPRKRIFNDEAQQEALDIFGVNAEELGAIDSDQEDADNEDDDEEYGDYEQEDDDVGGELGDDVEGQIEKVKKRQQRQRRLKSKHKIEDIFEPVELERNYLTDFDQQIRIEDEPERYMLRRIPVTAEPNELELDNEAEWIYKQLFEQKNSISQQDEQFKSSSVKPKIRDTLNFIRNQFLEVPFIALYRKEYILPELTVQDLWKIYEYDEKYCQLKQRKDNLIKLLQRMQKYQFNKLREATNAEKNATDSLSDLNLNDNLEITSSTRLLDTIRPIEEGDIERVKSLQTSNEYFDAYKHFKLYYSADLNDMRDKEKLEKQQQNKKSKRRNEDENENDDENDDENEDDEINDVDDTDDNKTIKKIASRKDRYHFCKTGGLSSLAKKFGLSAEQFGENLIAEYQKHEIDQWSVEPNVLAQEYVNERFNTIEHVLAGARHMVAMQITRDPNVKSVVRDLYLKRATLNIKPTAKGTKEIDENHSCYAFKYIKEKPVISLKAEQYLKIYQAKKDGLIDITFDVDSQNAIIYAQNEVNSFSGAQEDDFDNPVAANSANNSPFKAIANMPRQKISDRLKGFYQKDEFSYNVEQWNAQRGLIIDEALYKILYPELEQELHGKLLNEAKEHVLMAIKSKLNQWINIAPYKSETQQFDDVDQAERGCKVFSVAYSSDINDVAVCACVNGNGELDEFIRLRKILTRIDSRYTRDVVANSFANDRAEKIEDFEKLRKFLIEKKPNVIAVGAENKDALTIIDDLRKLVESIDASQVGLIQIELVDNEFAKLYSSTKLAEVEFRDQTMLLKQAIAQARHLQDPLLAFSQLFNVDNDILTLKFHQLQDSLEKQEIIRALELEFIDMTNLVGVDLNRCVLSPHTSNVLQFVSGLGPRKAQHILKTAKYRMPVMNRTFLVTDCQLGSKVFINCAGFIKFDVDNLAKEVDDEHDETRYTEVLDSTRIHPEAYDWARKMAVDALDLDDANEANSAVKEILECPGRLKDLDLDAFAKELERTGFGNKTITLYSIIDEFQNRYEDRRTPYRSPAAKERFHMLTKETPQTFYTGKLILCRVINIAHRRPTKEQLEGAEPIQDADTLAWQCPFCKRNNFHEFNQVWSHFDSGECAGPPVGVRIALDNGVSGFIPIAKLSDTRVTNPEDRLKVNQTIYARIVTIDIDRLSCELTSKSSDLKDVDNKWKPRRDEYYDDNAEKCDLDKIEDKKKRDEHRQAYTKRVIAHPQFKNISYQECVNMLNDMDVGDAIIRPSSKGIDHLTLTWKVNNDVYQHVDIIEEKKLNQFSLGKRLLIDGEEYEDLDEILARYVNPMGAYVRELLNYKYFNGDIDSTKLDTVENTLINEATTNPSRIPYKFICDRINPGKFIVSYVVRNKVRHEIIKITPDGYRFRQQIHKTFNGLINWFKKHYNDPISLSNAMNLTGSASSRIGTPQNLAANLLQAQNSLMSISQRTANSPFLTPAVPISSNVTAAAYNTPSSLISTPSTTTTIQTPNRAIQTPNRTPSGGGAGTSSTSYQLNKNTGSSTPYSPTHATTPHLQHFSSDNSDNSNINDINSTNESGFRRPIASGYNNRNNDNNQRNSNNYRNNQSYYGASNQPTSSSSNNNNNRNNNNYNRNNNNNYQNKGFNNRNGNNFNNRVSRFDNNNDNSWKSRANTASNRPEPVSKPPVEEEENWD